MLQINPENRPTAKELLKHVIFESYNLKEFPKNTFNQHYFDTLQNITDSESFDRIKNYFKTEF